MNATTNRKHVGVVAVLVSAGLAASVMARQSETRQPPSPPRPGETYKPGDKRDGDNMDRPSDKRDKWSHDSRPVMLVPSTWLDDNSIRGSNDEKLGEVKDLIVARAPGKVTFVLLGHGGVATIGEKVTAVPFRAFAWNADKKCLTLSMTEEQIKAAPTLESGEWKTLGDPSRTEPIYSHYNQTPDHRMTDRDDAPARPEDASKLRPEEHRVLRVSDIRGKELMGNDGREIGKVNDLVLDTSSGRIAFVAVTFGGLMGIGSDKVAVPWTAFDVNKDGHLFVTTIDKDTIKSAPRLTEKDWGELKEPGFGGRVYQHFGKKAPWLEASADGRDGMRSEYDRLYTSGTARDIQGTITSVDEDAPMSGEPKMVVLTVNTKGNESVKVDVCPKAYLDQNTVQLRKGDTVSIRGREATVDGKTVVIANQVTASDGHAVMLRRDDGTCTWQK